MKYRWIFISFTFLWLLPEAAFAQTFKATLLSGINAGQIDGDFEVGYNKLGFSGGVGIGITPAKNMYLGTEFLFSQRGSKNALFRSDNEANGSIRLNYIELPIVYKLFDWYDDKNQFYHVWIEAGLSGARLINANIVGSDRPELVNEFRTNDLSWFLGGGYYFNKHFNIGVRYTRSTFPFYVATNPLPVEVKKLLSYFITVRVGYTL